ncbi:MAG TPA: type II restriction endonuclease [Halothiobacillus sp.]|nr:type II restriction endonuclease [Halothiobacillus sp.]
MRARRSQRKKSKPDFLFPGVVAYQDPSFSPLKLTMLGVKSTCKDRWRQVLAEADRIETKHLLTLEAAISTQQADEMNARKVQLVLPKGLRSTYTQAHQNWLMDLSDFTELVRTRQ